MAITAEATESPLAARAQDAALRLFAAMRRRELPDEAVAERAVTGEAARDDLRRVAAALRKPAGEVTLADLRRHVIGGAAAASGSAGRSARTTSMRDELEAYRRDVSRFLQRG